MSSAAQKPPLPLFVGVRPACWRTLVAFAVVHTGLLLLFFTDAFGSYVSEPLFVATRGLVTHTLVTNLFELVILVGGVIFLLGRLRPGDVGLDAAKVGNALLITLLLWALVQLVTVLIGQLEGIPLVLNPNLFTYRTTVLLGRPLEATLGSALVEEVTYRGFLFPQLYLLSGNRWPFGPKGRLVFALVAPQVYFGLNHLPAGLNMDLTTGALLLWVLHVILVGVFFALIYLRTDNLFVAIGVHGLLNNPLSLFVSSVDPALFVLVFALLLLFAWPTLARWFGSVFTLRAAIAGRWKRAR